MYISYSVSHEGLEKREKTMVCWDSPKVSRCDLVEVNKVLKLFWCWVLTRPAPTLHAAQPRTFGPSPASVFSDSGLYLNMPLKFCKTEMVLFNILQSNQLFSCFLIALIILVWLVAYNCFWSAVFLAIRYEIVIIIWSKALFEFSCLDTSDTFVENNVFGLCFLKHTYTFFRLQCELYFL